MRHARPETLKEVEPLLQELRSVPGLVEKRPGVFYRRSKAFLHFHEDPSGLHADVRFGEEFERVRVETDMEHEALIERIKSYVAMAPSRRTGATPSGRRPKTQKDTRGRQRSGC